MSRASERSLLSSSGARVPALKRSPSTDDSLSRLPSLSRNQVDGSPRKKDEAVAPRPKKDEVIVSPRGVAVDDYWDRVHFMSSLERYRELAYLLCNNLSYAAMLVR
jgi:hypothetical protein